MGFDINGINPKSDTPQPPWGDTEEAQKAYRDWLDNTKGAYFRNNVWWWRPLWVYVCSVCDDILTHEDKEHGHYNDAWLIDEEKAIRIAIRLKHLLSQGKVKDYEKKYKSQLKHAKDEPCELCDASGTRLFHGNWMKCNGCGGKGKRRPFETNYPFDTENVEAFATFCQNSGGFEIC